jgi:hypothetical protein
VVLNVEALANDDPMPAGYMPGSEAARGLLLLKLRQALSEVPYLRIVSASSEGSRSEMVSIQVRSTICSAAETAEADIRTVWERSIVGSSTSILRIHDKPDGFDFKFALLQEAGDFLTCSIGVSVR